MKIRHSLLILAALLATGIGQEVVTLKTPPVPGAAPPAANAWLGFSVRKPDPNVTARIPMLPAGIGFVVQTVAPGGPAEAAQLKPQDVLWKFGDQMLVNQGQLATLLSLKSPGDEVTLALFRAGSPLEIKITLGTAKDDKNLFSKDMADAVILSDEGSQMRIVNLHDRTASFSNNEGKALVRREGDGYKVVINGADKQILYEGVLPIDGSLDGIPADWHRRVCVLRRSLDHALENRIVPMRMPRSRVVPPSAVPPPGTP
jgi:hypothetical protein